VAIDTVGHKLQFRAIRAETADDRLIDPKLAFAQVRYYEFTPTGLTTTVKDAKGEPTAIATWKKID
jgi:hypothetical protein